MAQIIKKATEWLVRDENGLHRFNTEEEAKAHAAGGAVAPELVSKKMKSPTQAEW